MPDLPEALDAALRAHYRVTDIRTPATHRRGLTARMSRIEKATGTRAEAAKATGISLRTWQRWRAGTQKPGAAALRKLETAFNRLVTLPRTRKMLKSKGVPSRVTVSAEVRWNGYYNRHPQRTVRLGPKGVQAAMRHTIRVWSAAGPEAAAEAFQRGLSAAYEVPDETDGSPGIQFEGDQVEVRFE